MDLFDLQAKIALDTSDYENGLNNASGKWQGFGKMLKGGAGKLAKVGAVALTAASGAVVAFGKKAIDAGMQFDSAMSQVAATMGKSMSELEQETGTVSTAFGEFSGNLREYAQFMGANTAFSASQAAEALNYMALAGYDVQTSMDMLPNVLNLAAAGGMELATASDMITDAQTALGLSIEETNTMVDQMAKTSATTNTSVSQLGEAILTIGGTAQFMAGGTEELNTVLGVLADNGIKGSEAGTHLRNMLLKLSDPTDDGAEALAQLGVEVFDAEGKMRSFSEIFPEMNAAMSDLTEEQRIQALGKIFNTRDVAAATALMGTSVDRWNEVGQAIDGAAGSAQKMADTQLDNLQGDITLFKSALEGTQIAISDELNPALRGLVKEGTTGLSRLTEAIQNGGFSAAIDVAADLVSEWTQKLVEGIPKVLEVGGKLLVALGKGIIRAVPSVIKGVRKIGTDLISGLRDSIVKAIPSMARKTALSLMNISGTIKDGIMGMFDNFESTFPAFLETGTQIITSIIDGVKRAYPTMINQGKEILKRMITGIINAIPGLITAAGTILKSLADYFMTSAPVLMDAGMDILRTLVSGIKNGIPNIITAVKDVVTNVGGAIGAGFPTLLAKGREMLTQIASGISEGISLIPGTISGIITSIAKWIEDNGETLLAKGGEIMDSVISGIGNAIENIGDKLSEFLQFISDWFTKNPDGLNEDGETIVGFIADGIGMALEKIGTAILSLVVGIITWIINNKGSIITIGKSIVAFIIKGIGDAIINIGQGFLNLVTELGDWLTDNQEDVAGVGTDILDAIVSGISDFIGNIKDGFTELLPTLVEAVTSLATGLGGIGRRIVLHIRDGIKNNIERIKNGFNTLLSKIREKISSINLLQIGKAIIDKIVEGIKKFAGNIASALKKAVKDAVKSAMGMKVNEDTGVVEEGVYSGHNSEFAKAKNAPYLFNHGTVFGRYRDENLIAGEAGPEMLLGVNKLNSMLETSVHNGMVEMGGAVGGMMSQMMAMIQGMQAQQSGTVLQQEILNVLNTYFPQVANMQLVLDTGAIAGAVTPGINQALGNQVGGRRRYNA